jgi:hypothetical protein
MMTGNFPGTLPKYRHNLRERKEFFHAVLKKCRKAILLSLNPSAGRNQHPRTPDQKIP